MIPVEQKRDVFSSGAEGTASFEISTGNAAHIMTILRDTLYSDKVLAVLREYGANAWDANRIAGRGDWPIKVTLPTLSDPVLKIRDDGDGMSIDDVFTVYTQYGDSTKRGDNLAVGMLGIGSKSGFAYSDSFTVISWHGGTRATYVAVIDQSEKGRIDLLDVQELQCRCGGGHVASMATEDCPRPETGIEIQIPVRPRDIGEFTQKAQTIFAFFNPRPEINTTLPTVPNGKDFPGLGTVILSVDRYNPGSMGWTAVMGCVPYKVNVGQLTNISSSSHNVSGILYFDIGSLQVAASREELKYGDSTKEALSERINSIIDRYIEHLLEGLDKLTQWERRLRIKDIVAMRLTVPESLSSLRDSIIQFKTDPTFKMKSRGYKGKTTESNYIRVDVTTRLVIRDDRRSMGGYSLVNGDVIIEPNGDERLALSALNKRIKEHQLEGIPIVRMSTLTWTRPASAAKPVDSARARAACLILDVKNIGADRKSERWTPIARIPKPTDVYVVLDSYTVEDMDGFYDSFSSDNSMIESIGGKMPEIIGYRNTKAQPVDKLKLKGKTFRSWRQDDYVKFLMSQPGVTDGVNAKTWSNVNNYGVTQSHVAMFGGSGHAIGRFMTKVLDAKLDFYKISRNMMAVINRCFFSSKPNEADLEWKQIVEMYPMLAVMGTTSIHMFASEHARKWVDYINLVDSSVKTAAGQQQQQEQEIAA